MDEQETGEISEEDSRLDDEDDLEDDDSEIEVSFSRKKCEKFRQNKNVITWKNLIWRNFFGFQDDDEDDEDLEEEEDPNQRFLLSKNSEVVSGGMKS